MEIYSRGRRTCARTELLLSRLIFSVGSKATGRFQVTSPSLNFSRPGGDGPYTMSLRVPPYFVPDCRGHVGPMEASDPRATLATTPTMPVASCSSVLVTLS